MWPRDRIRAPSTQSEASGRHLTPDGNAMKLKMKTLQVLIAGSVALLAASVGAIYAGSHAGLSARAAALVEEGRQVFRYDPFGDAINWTDQLRMNEVIRDRKRDEKGKSVYVRVATGGCRHITKKHFA